MATAPPVNLWTVLSESKRIINAHSRHFLALSVLFLLPFCFSVTVYPSVVRLLTDKSAVPDSISLLSHSHDDHGTTLMILSITYTVVVCVFNLLAMGSITYSVFQGFYGRPVKLWAAIKSSLTSFCRLWATLICVEIIFLAVFLVLGFLMFALIRGLGFAGLEIQYSSPYFVAICIVFTIVFMAISINLGVNWILAWVIVVVESLWGFKPLKRSKGLIKGMRGVALSIIFFFGFIESILVWISSVASAAQIGGDADGSWWTKACFVLQIVITSAFLTLLTLYSMAANTVLYMYCRAVHGELALEIAEEFAREYVSLPFDDGKVPHLVYVAYNV